jgi:hypothetical protein
MVFINQSNPMYAMNRDEGKDDVNLNLELEKKGEAAAIALEEKGQVDKKKKKNNIREISLVEVFLIPGTLLTCVLLSSYAWIPTVAATYEVTLSGCDPKSYSVQASWPDPSASYYAADSYTNITANSAWYFNQNPCVGWVFNRLKGFCQWQLQK